MTKYCKICGEKDETKLQLRKNRKGVYVRRWRCVSCASKQHYAWQAGTNGGYAKYRQKLWRDFRERILRLYGNRCVCCGETHIEFLGIDHIEGNGHQHRRSLGGSSQFYKWLAAERREGFRVLCHNCNLARGFYGYCPHEREREEALRKHAESEPILVAAEDVSIEELQAMYEHIGMIQ